MNSAARERLFGAEHAFDHPIAIWVTIGLVVVLGIAPAVFILLAKIGRISNELRTELFRRYYSWLVLVPILLVPTLLGAFWVIVGVGILSLLCYREYARATGLFREKLISLVHALGIVALTLAVLDHWFRLWVALTPLVVAALAVTAVFADQPKGYIQRVALAVLGFLMFGTCLSHLGYIANDRNYRPVLILLVLSVEANDVFAFIVGKAVGGRKLAPNTSPAKTMAGAFGALILTTLLVIGVGQTLFRESLLQEAQITRLQEIRHLAVLGVVISVIGQLGDLVLSSIKRDLGLKEMGTWIPGHGGLLDRFDSLLFVAPAVFHYANYIAGIGLDRPERVFSGG